MSIKEAKTFSQSLYDEGKHTHTHTQTYSGFISLKASAGLAQFDMLYSRIINMWRSELKILQMVVNYDLAMNW